MGTPVAAMGAPIMGHASVATALYRIIVNLVGPQSLYEFIIIRIHYTNPTRVTILRYRIICVSEQAVWCHSGVERIGNAGGTGKQVSVRAQTDCQVIVQAASGSRWQR
jgi:hypothetical protein